MFKLGTTVQEASICLRCQYHMSLRSQPRIKQQRSPKPKHNRQFLLGRRLRQEQELLRDNDAYGGALGKPIISYELFEPFEPAESALKGRFRKRYRYPLPTKDSLGVSSLGQPAEVLILRDHGQERDNSEKASMTLRSSQSESSPSTELLSSTSLVAELDGERGIVDVNQVCQNIDTVKDTWVGTHNILSQAAGSVVTRRQFEELVSKLYDGFTMSQLGAYWEGNENSQPADPLDLHDEFLSSLYARSPWSTGITDLWRIKAPEIAATFQNGDCSESGIRKWRERLPPHKRTLAERILRDCWQFRPQENESSLGEMDIRLEPIHLELIVNHKRGILRQVSETYGAKVEASRRDQVIRITSDYDTSLDVLKLIIHTLGNIRSSTIDLPILHRPEHLPANPHEEAFDTISRQVMQSTNTIIWEVPTWGSKRELHVYYLGPDDEDLEDARRLINQVLTAVPVQEDLTGRFTKEKKILLGRGIQLAKDILAPIDVGNGLSLMDRTQQWSRWCSPSIREVDLKSKPEGPSTTSLNTLHNPLDQKEVACAMSQFFSAPDEIYKIAEETRTRWMSNISYWDSAMVGQVLFPTPVTRSGEVPLRPFQGAKGLQLKLNKWRREFVTLVPGLVQHLERLGLESLDAKPWKEDFLLIRLIPSFQNTLPLPRAVIPNLEIRIFLDQDSRTTNIGDVRLINRDELDVLLPKNTMDLRFARRKCVYSRRSGLDPRIRQFVHESNLDIWGTDRLKTPKGLTLSIPPHSLRPLLDGRSTEGFEHEQVQYTFASLEHRSEIGIHFGQTGSWGNLIYTSIEAGKIGGRRDELCLRQSRRPKNATAADFEVEKEEMEDSAAEDERHSSSLLHKVNTLINSIEKPSENDTKKWRYGVGKASATLGSRSPTAIMPPMSRGQKREENRLEAVRAKKRALGLARERYTRGKRSSVMGSSARETGPRVVRIMQPSTGARVRKVGRDRPGPAEGAKGEDEEGRM